MLIGYARVSTTEQNPQLRINALTRAGWSPAGDDPRQARRGPKAAGVRDERPGSGRSGRGLVANPVSAPIVC